MPPSDTAQAGTDKPPVPPDCATPEAALLRDTNHCINMADLLLAVGRPASQDLLGRLTERARDLHARIESGGGRVPGSR